VVEIFENSVIGRFKDDMTLLSIERVLWISPQLDTVVLIRIDEKKGWPYWINYEDFLSDLTTPFVKKLDYDPYFHKLNPDEEISIDHLKIRDSAWEIIKEIVEEEPAIFQKEKRLGFKKIIKEKYGIRDKRLDDLLRRYWIGGKQKNALIPNYENCGGRGKKRTRKEKKLGRNNQLSKIDPSLIGVNVTESDKEIFKLAIKRFHKGQKLNIAKTYRRMKEEFYFTGYKMRFGELTKVLKKTEFIPTEKQFRTWYKDEYSATERKKNEVGELKYNTTHRSTLGNATKKSYGPCSIFEIDATMADVYLVSAFDRSKLIGRPIVYIVKDVYSRLVVGVYVGLEGPSWLGAMMAIENATKNKKEYCEGLGIAIEDDTWPCHHIPRKFVADRGEMLSKNSDDLTEILGIRITNTPPYRGDLKGIVERHFRILNEKIKEWVPGAVQVDHRSRIGKDYALDGKLTIKSFEEIIIYSILEHNQKIITDYPMEKEMIEDGVVPTPIEIWKWGKKHRSSIFREANTNLVKFSLLPKANASITENGIYANKRYYSCELAIREGWFERISGAKSKKIRVSYDPRNINQIHFILTDNEIVTANLIEHQLGFDISNEIRMEDVLQQDWYNTTLLKSQENEQQQNASDINNKINSIIKREKKKTEKVQNKGQSKAEKRKDMKETRSNEKLDIREKELWSNLDGSSPEKTFENNVVKMEIPDEPIGNRLLDLIINNN
jgi:putative transposase